MENDCYWSIVGENKHSTLCDRKYTGSITVTTSYQATPEFVISIGQFFWRVSLENDTAGIVFTIRIECLKRVQGFRLKHFQEIVCCRINECYTWIAMHVSLPHSSLAAVSTESHIFVITFYIDLCLSFDYLPVSFISLST